MALINTINNGINCDYYHHYLILYCSTCCCYRFVLLLLLLLVIIIAVDKTFTIDKLQGTYICWEHWARAGKNHSTYFHTNGMRFFIHSHLYIFYFCHKEHYPYFEKLFPFFYPYPQNKTLLKFCFIKPRKTRNVHI